MLAFCATRSPLQPEGCQDDFFVRRDRKRLNESRCVLGNSQGVRAMRVGDPVRRRGNPETLLVDGIAHRLELEPHGERRAGLCVWMMKTRGPQMGARFLTEPADDGHAAVVAVVVDEVFASQVMVEVDFVPGFVKCSDAIGDRLDANCVSIFSQELDCSNRVVVQEKDTTSV